MQSHHVLDVNVGEAMPPPSGVSGGGADSLDAEDEEAMRRFVRSQRLLRSFNSALSRAFNFTSVVASVAVMARVPWDGCAARTQTWLLVNAVLTVARSALMTAMRVRREGRGTSRPVKGSMLVTELLWCACIVVGCVFTWTERGCRVRDRDAVTVSFVLMAVISVSTLVLSFIKAAVLVLSMFTPGARAFRLAQSAMMALPFQPASESEIDGLGSVAYFKGLFEDPDNVTCAICLTEYEEGEELRFLPCRDTADRKEKVDEGPDMPEFVMVDGDFDSEEFIRNEDTVLEEVVEIKADEPLEEKSEKLAEESIGKLAEEKAVEPAIEQVEEHAEEHAEGHAENYSKEVAELAGSSSFVGSSVVGSAVARRRDASASFTPKESLACLETCDSESAHFVAAPPRNVATVAFGEQATGLEKASASEQFFAPEQLPAPEQTPVRRRGDVLEGQARAARSDCALLTAESSQKRSFSKLIPPRENSTLEKKNVSLARKSSAILALKPKQGHAFHADCIDAWLHRQRHCPTCRQDIVPSLRPMPDGSNPLTNAIRRAVLSRSAANSADVNDELV